VPHDVVRLLGPIGTATSAALLEQVDPHTLGRWVRQGLLLRPYPGVLLLAERRDDWRTRALAAVLATGGVLSHRTALSVWRVLPPAGPVHVSVPAARRALVRPGLVVHRVTSLPTDRLGPFPVTDLARGLVDTWGWACGRSGSSREREAVRGALITSVRERQVSTRATREELARRPQLAGRRALLDLLTLLDQGCQSELEIWGVRHVLAAPGLPAFVQQHRVRLPTGTVHLDAAVPDLLVAVELDGAAFHGSAADRERDTRRDVSLAALGWVVLRFSYRRLTTDPEGCRREIASVCAARRRQLGTR
jgi:Protein of unknown function (DUF559)